MNADRPHRRLVLAGLGASLLAPRTFAQGFAGLGEDASGYAQVTRGVPPVLPDDLGPHPEFRTEWWYVTATLRGEDGADYGVQWTLFRQALAQGVSGDGWADPHVWMGHAALTSVRAHRFAERLGRGGTGQAGAQAAPFRAWIDDWILEDGDGVWAMQAAGPDFAYDLRLAPRGDFIRHGEGGYSVKSGSGQASYYFSQPFFDAGGAVTLDGAPVAVTGRAWLDREWSSQPLAEGQTGWDWLSLHLESGDKLMAFALRGAGGAPFHSGTWIEANGTAHPLAAGAIELIPGRAARVAGRRIPVRWRVRIPSRGMDIEVAALNPDAWNGGSVPYWEGPVRATGTHDGEGYLEMTGY